MQMPTCPQQVCPRAYASRSSTNGLRRHRFRPRTRSRTQQRYTYTKNIKSRVRESVIPRGLRAGKRKHPLTAGDWKFWPEQGFLAWFKVPGTRFTVEGKTGSRLRIVNPDELLPKIEPYRFFRRFFRGIPGVPPDLLIEPCLTQHEIRYCRWQKGKVSCAML